MISKWPEMATWLVEAPLTHRPEDIIPITIRACSSDIFTIEAVVQITAALVAASIPRFHRMKTTRRLPAQTCPDQRLGF